MPLLIVENGTLVPGANSYATVEMADAYHQARGSEEWPISSPEPDPAPEPDDGADESDTDADTPGDVDTSLAQKEAALIRATDYLNGLAWKGRRAAVGRVMAWPRIEVIDADGYEIASDSVPENVVFACCHLAGLIFAGTDAQPVLDRGGRVQSEGVSGLNTSYFDDAANRDVYAGVADLLSGLAYGFDQYAGVGKIHSGGSVQGKVRI